MGAANSKQVLVLENIPIVGHCIALKHAIDGNGAAARRAAIKSTNGLIVTGCTLIGGATAVFSANPILGAAIGGALGGGLGLTWEGGMREIVLPEHEREGLSKLTFENYVWAIGIGGAQGAAGGAVAAKFGEEAVISAFSATLRNPAPWLALSKFVAKEVAQGLVKGAGKLTKEAKSKLEEHLAKTISHGFIDLNLVGQAVVRKAVIAELLPPPKHVPDKNVMFWSSIITGPYLVKGQATVPVFGKIGHEWVMGKCVFAADGDVSAWYPWGGKEHYFKGHDDSNDNIHFFLRKTGHGYVWIAPDEIATYYGGAAKPVSYTQPGNVGPASGVDCIPFCLNKDMRVRGGTVPAGTLGKATMQLGDGYVSWGGEELKMPINDGLLLCEVEYESKDERELNARRAAYDAVDAAHRA